MGVHAVQALARQELPAGVEAVDGGTGGFHLLGELQGAEELVMIDATLDGRAPGTVRVLRPRFASDYPRSLGAHDVGLRDLIEAAALLGSLPSVHLVTVSIAQVGPPGIGLSPEVEAALPEVVRTVRALVGAPAA